MRMICLDCLERNLQQMKKSPILLLQAAIHAPTIMAHCVHSTDEEIQMIKDQGVYIAHCPESNTDIASGIAPIRRYLDMGLHVGLGTDVAGGFSLFHVPRNCRCHPGFQLRWRLMDQTQAPGYSGRSFLHGHDRWWLLLRKSRQLRKRL